MPDEIFCSVVSRSCEPSPSAAAIDMVGVQKDGSQFELFEPQFGGIDPIDDEPAGFAFFGAGGEGGEGGDRADASGAAQSGSHSLSAAVAAGGSKNNCTALSKE